MQRNDKLLTMVLSGILTLSLVSVYGQTNQESKDSIKNEKMTFTIDVLTNTLISPFIGSSANSPRYGGQLRFNVKNHAYRLSAEYQNQQSFFFRNSSLISSTDSTINYANRNFQINRYTGFVGLEFVKSRTWGKLFFGSDIGILLVDKRYQTSLSTMHFATDSTYNRTYYYNINHANVQDYGAILKPFIGMRFPLFRNMEMGATFRTDIQFIKYRAIGLNENNTLKIGSPQFSFRTLPFIDLRLSYTLGNGRK